MQLEIENKECGLYDNEMSCRLNWQFLGSGISHNISQTNWGSNFSEILDLKFCSLSISWVILLYNLLSGSGLLGTYDSIQLALNSGFENL
jgi:hypothetical protein